MRRRFSMFAICGSRSARADDENNKITDSLEQCLSLEKGVKDFQSFLKRGRFDQDAAALEFYLKSRNILIEVAKYSPNSRNHTFSKKLDADVSVLFKMAGDVNFDQYQMEDMESTFLSGLDEEKINKISEAQKWTVDILQHIYETFRRDALSSRS